MKKTISTFALTCATAFLAACSSPKEEGFSIDFNLTDVPDCNLFVAENVPGTSGWFIDTLEVKKGKAHYEGKIDFPRLTTFHFISETNVYGQVEVFLDNSHGIQVNGKTTGDAIITGCKTQDEYQLIREKLEEAVRQISKSKQDISKVYDEKAGKEIIDSLENVQGQKEAAMLDQLVKLPGYSKSAVTPYFVYNYFMDSPELLEKALTNVDAALDNNAYVKEEKAELARHKSSAIGQPAYNFCLKDINGKEYKLSDFKGKYVLIEFSASWCGWCKKEIPFLKTVYKENKEKNFVLLTINMDDNQKKWEDDVKEMNLPWPVISDLKAFKGEVAQAFNVHGIPLIYLINPEGKIEMRGLRGEEMIRTLRETIKK